MVRLCTSELHARGHIVNVAARLMEQAGPGEILISENVQDQLTPVLDADLEDLGMKKADTEEKVASMTSVI